VDQLQEDARGHDRADTRGHQPRDVHAPVHRQRRHARRWWRRGPLLVLVAVLAGTGLIGVRDLAQAQGAKSQYISLTPKRLLDTRLDGAGPLGPGEIYNLVVSGGSSPAPNDATSVVLNVTAILPTTEAYLALWPKGQQPATPISNVNFIPNQTVANQVIVGVGTAGQVAIFNPAGATHVAVDLLGYFTP
jgi:hypothetical protein